VAYGGLQSLRRGNALKRIAIAGTCSAPKNGFGCFANNSNGIKKI
jgi:hypothetical protein